MTDENSTLENDPLQWEVIKEAIREHPEDVRKEKNGLRVTLRFTNGKVLSDFVYTNATDKKMIRDYVRKINQAIRQGAIRVREGAARVRESSP